MPSSWTAHTVYMIISSANAQRDFTVDEAREYLLTIKGVWDGASVALQIWNEEKAAYYAVDGGTFTESTKTEDRITSSSAKVRLTATGTTGNTHLSAQFLRIKSK